jgi:serine/threonine protein kinase
MEDPSLPVVIDEETTLRDGTRLGKYQIVRLLGQGGMGAVYEAFHTEIGKRVAIKTLAPAVAAIPGARQRFLREAQLTSRLRHPHIVDLTDMGSEGRIAYLVMELLAGEDLANRLERAGVFSPRELVDLMLPVCSALVTAHEAGIVHRDLKPQNIFLASGHHGVVPKVLDFGISKSSDTDAASSLTSTGSVIGTPHYLAPEQIKDARTASAASDQYALGVIFYKCLAGENPFEGESIFAVLQAIVTQTPVPLQERRADLPEGFVRIVERAMNPLPWERFGSVRELGRVLLPYASPKARAIWEEIFTGASDAAAAAEPPRASHTMPMPPPEPRPRRLAAEHTTAKARFDSGTLSPAVTDTAPANLGADAGSRRRTMIGGTLLGVALAVGGFVLFTRVSPAPEPRPPAAAAPPAAAPVPVTPPPAVVNPPAVPVVAPPPVAAPVPAKEPVAPEAAAKPEPTKESIKEEAAPPKREAAVEKPVAPASAHRRTSAPSRHGAVRPHPEAPAASPRSLNPNGAPVID